jgi:hypothetical protein
MCHLYLAEGCHLYIALTEPRREAEIMDNVSIQKAIELRDSLLAELRQNQIFQAHQYAQAAIAALG